ncbi:MAG: site-2 protease family protein, partial [Planctomycetes bacterium]|nr:site-2 protease family protein [Planctomycetota bacterium]
MSWFIIVVLIAWSLAMSVFPELYGELAPTTYWLMGVVGAVGLFACVLLHELGHALVARRFDVPMSGITLFIFGGVAEMRSEPPHARAEILVALGGPAVTAALAGMFGLAGLLPMPTAVGGVIAYLLLLNVVLFVFNAIPAFPLDGGRVLRGILWHMTGSLRRATATSSRIGSGFGALLIVLAVLQLLTGNFVGAIWWFVLGMFLRNAAQMGHQQVLVRDVLKGEPVRRFMTADPITVSPDTTIDELVDRYIYEHHFKLFPVT